MLTVAVCWGLLLCGSALTLNAAAVAALLNSWHLYRGGGGWRWGRNPPSAVVVGEREATGYIVFLFALACNILFVVFSKVPFLHRAWHSSLLGDGGGDDVPFLFGPRLCVWTHLADGALSSAPTVALCFYLGHVWLRVGRRRRTEKEDVSELANGSVLGGRRSGGGGGAVKDGAILALASLGWSAAVAAVVAYRMKLDVRDDAALCLSTWRDSLWLSAFRWTLSHLGPLGLAALPALARLSCSGARRRMGEQLRACVSLAAMALLVHFLLALPSLIQELFHWVTYRPPAVGDPGHDGPSSSSSSASSAGPMMMPGGGNNSSLSLGERRDERAFESSRRFIAFVLTRALPELSLLYLPAGVLAALPVRVDCRAPELDAEKGGEKVYATISGYGDEVDEDEEADKDEEEGGTVTDPEGSERNLCGAVGNGSGSSPTLIATLPKSNGGVHHRMHSPSPFSSPSASSVYSSAWEENGEQEARSLLLGKGEDSVYNYDGERRRRLHQSSIGIARSPSHRISPTKSVADRSFLSGGGERGEQRFGRRRDHQFEPPYLNARRQFFYAPPSHSLPRPRPSPQHQQHQQRRVSRGAEAQDKREEWREASKEEQEEATTVGVVRAEVHQRLSKSRTTIV